MSCREQLVFVLFLPATEKQRGKQELPRLHFESRLPHSKTADKLEVVSVVGKLTATQN